MTSTHQLTHRAPSLLRQTKVIAGRSVMATLRRPASIIPPMVFPVILLIINSAGLEDAARLDNFPADRYVDFLFVLTFMQGCLFATTTAGLALGRDIEQGFIDRLALTPMRGAALILGQLAGAATIALMASFVYIAIGLLLGVEFKSGVLGVAALVVLAVTTALTFASIGAFLALRAGSSEAVQGLFPLLFATLFLSTLNMPRDLIETDWFRWITQVNPVSYLIDGMRSLVIADWDWEALATDVAVLAVLLTLGLWGCSVALRQRLTRT